ncbi:DUF448 domain-containing protein [Sphingomonas sp. S1-29]|uniref:DUF448 domain-containing protein n=1 Tax=Sphingomonas sp. S1-29 TaxID=2991074 RepID=UPI00223EDB56|nr:DUF448 domain-containing protein [Sphingomonas sp. S1-29]UZK71082.1 DUF448 domain-containing protein [Sphingomonas sp. S1-29]
MEGEKNPRTCVLSREEAPREGLVRLVLGPDNQVHPDVRAKAPGRGGWIGVTRVELEAALAKGKLRGGLARAFKTGDFTIAPDLPQRIEDQLRRNALDRLGLESKAGFLIVGGDRIGEAARSGKLRVLLHAADASEDGSRKLAQAWRVGSDREGSDLKGMTLPIDRTILSLALGRENVVHAAVTDPKAAKRVSEALTRWLHFIGPDPAPLPCETGSQGASAASAADARGPAGTNEGP